LAAAADAVNADWLVYVPGNRPFIDPALVDCLLSRALSPDSEHDYVGFCAHDGSWERIGQLGVAGEVCHADALRRLRRNIDRMLHTPEQLSLAGWLHAAPGNYQLKFVSIHPALDRHDLRFSIEDESDWELAELLSDHVGDELTEWQMLTNLIHDNHTLREVMAERNSVANS
jgi:spore coat polysaccharide biosynthesis protein SpsF (cytidylyltransferase family)